MEPKPKRPRTNPPKRWTVADEVALVDYLLENRDFEKPTAKKYYDLFTEEHQVPIEWKQVCAKVRNMRMSFYKAKSWEASTEALSLDEETLKNNLLNMFSYFYEFDDIFGNKNDQSAVIDESLEYPKLCDGEDCVSNMGDEHDSIEELDMIEEADNTDDFVSIEDDQMFLQSPKKTENLSELKGLSNTNQKTRHNAKSAMSDIMRIQNLLLNLKRRKLRQEIAATEKALLIREREVALMEKEFELKQRQVASQKKLKILELEMKERLAKEELKLKYKTKF